MKRIIVIGGGWAGCSAAITAARNYPGQVCLVEKNDMLLGTGLSGGIFRNNGRFTAAEEGLLMGIDLFEVMDAVARHDSIDFPGHLHTSLYDIFAIEPRVSEQLAKTGVMVYRNTRAVDARLKGGRLEAVRLDPRGDGDPFWLEGTAFIDATGSGGSPRRCRELGFGCVMCLLRCPASGRRLSLCGLLDAAVFGSRRQDYVAVSGSCKLALASLAPGVRGKLQRDGVFIKELPPGASKGEIPTRKACQQYTDAVYTTSLVLLDTGEVKMMRPFLPLRDLRALEGFENARYLEPLSGGLGNSIRFTEIVEADDFMSVRGFENLLCAGELAGLRVGHTEAIITGALAGFNAFRLAVGRDPVRLSIETACGDFIAHSRREVYEREELGFKYTFSGSVYFDRMRAKGLYTTDRDRIRERIRVAGLEGMFA